LRLLSNIPAVAPTANLRVGFREVAKHPANFAVDGAQLFEGALERCMPRLEAVLSDLAPDVAGVRLHRLNVLEPLLRTDGCIGAIAATVLGVGAKPVRAILFNKSQRTNWSLAWHQDRTICVKKKKNVPGFGPWTVKDGMIHVEPPFELLKKMATLRAHLDDVPMDNAPLLIAPGSHRFGRIPIGEVDDVVRRCGIRVCTANAGDVWLYATPVLHASEAASAPNSRRVLQVDFAAEVLPHGLEWLGI
jgi:hypothetical protein